MNREFDGNFVQLVNLLEDAALTIDQLPDDQEFSQDALATFDDVRHAALRLAEKAEALLKEITGQAS